MILADTDVLIDYLAGVSPVREQVARLISSEALQTTAISCFEILSGADEGKRRDAARALVALIASLPLDFAAAERAAGVRRALDRAGQSIGMADSLIAGIALTHSRTLFTRNRSHFERVAGLELLETQRG
jgi:tRNA(fMet)-specific endonuclease VapC